MNRRSGARPIETADNNKARAAAEAHLADITPDDNGGPADDPDGYDPAYLASLHPRR